MLFPLGSSDAGVGAAQPPRVGRDKELDQLLMRWNKARSGQGGIALVSCAAGGGKSRLVQEFLAACGRDTPVLQGKSAPDEAVPLAPLRAAVEQHLGAMKGLAEPARSAALERVRTAAQPVALMIPTLSPSLTDLIEARQVPGEDMQEPFTNAVATFLTALLSRPVARSCTWTTCDGWTRGRCGCWSSVGRSGADATVCHHHYPRRRGEPGTVEAFSAGLERMIDTRISLAPFDDRAVGELIAGHLGGAAVASALTVRLAPRCAGNPLMVGEYLRAVVDAGLLRPSWGVWVLEEEGLDALALPEDVLALIGSRVQGLGLDTRRVLTAAAAIGMRFSSDLLAAVSGLAERSVQAAVRVALDRRLAVAADGGGYGFAHDRIREALLADADEPLRGHCISASRRCWKRRRPPGPNRSTRWLGTTCAGRPTVLRSGRLLPVWPPGNWRWPNTRRKRRWSICSRATRSRRRRGSSPIAGFTPRWGSPTCGPRGSMRPERRCRRR